MDCPFDGQHLQQFRDGDDLIGLFRHLDLAEHQALARREGGDHVDRRLAVLLLAGPPNRLAVDGDHPLGSSGQRRDPGNKAALELLGIQDGENVAEMIVRRRAFVERTEAAQQAKLLAAEQGDIGDRLGAGQHGEQAKKQDLLQRIVHLPLLARILQVLEITQENNTLVERCATRCGACHGTSPHPIRGLP